MWLVARAWSCCNYQDFSCKFQITMFQSNIMGMASTMLLCPSHLVNLILLCSFFIVSSAPTMTSTLLVFNFHILLLSNWPCSLIPRKSSLHYSSDLLLNSPSAQTPISCTTCFNRSSYLCAWYFFKCSPLIFNTAFIHSYKAFIWYTVCPCLL